MYIPKDLLQLIDRYNEEGIFIINYPNIYWFNAKRFEFWVSGFEDVLYYKNNLYVKNVYDRVLIYVHKEFHFIETEPANLKYNNLLKLFFNPNYKTMCINNDTVFTVVDNKQISMYNGKKTTFITNDSPTCYQLFYLNDYIYIFGAVSTHSAKYNLTTKKWSILDDSELFGMIYQFQNKFYSFEDNKKNLWCYDVKTGWIQTSTLVPAFLEQ